MRQQRVTQRGGQNLMPNFRNWEWPQTRDMMIFGAGMLLSLAASRVAPPIAGRAIGSIRAMTGTDPFDALAQDHRKVRDAVPIRRRPARDLPADLLRAVSRLPALAQPEAERRLVDVGRVAGPMLSRYFESAAEDVGSGRVNEALLKWVEQNTGFKTELVKTNDLPDWRRKLLRVIDN